MDGQPKASKEHIAMDLEKQTKIVVGHGQLNNKIKNKQRLALKNSSTGQILNLLLNNHGFKSSQSY